jgi:uncharacterized protein YrzB (UPF0473 family)
MSEFENIDDLINDDETYDVLVMTDEDGNEVQYFVIDGIEADGTNYILVVDAQSYKDENEETEAHLLKETKTDGENAVYEPVSDDNEYQKIVVLLQENDPDYEMNFE